MRVKICGITKPHQGKEIVRLGATALGFICVPSSPRYVKPENIRKIVTTLPHECDTIGVFADASLETISQVVRETRLTGVQLHGSETTEFCQNLRKLLTNEVELIKAFRVKTPSSLEEAHTYSQVVDSLLLDAYHPQLLGGSGLTLNWSTLSAFKPPVPWFLAGGLTPDNIVDALEQLHPDGIDLSSGVEISPGHKDLTKVAQLFNQLQGKISLTKAPLSITTWS